MTITPEDFRRSIEKLRKFYPGKVSDERANNMWKMLKDRMHVGEWQNMVENFIWASRHSPHEHEKLEKKIRFKLEKIEITDTSFERNITSFVCDKCSNGELMKFKDGLRYGFACDCFKGKALGFPRWSEDLTNQYWDSMMESIPKEQ